MTLSEDMMLKCSEHLSAYKSACEDHPDLKAFDSDLQQRTIKVVDSLTVEAESEPLSIHALHMEVSEHLHEVTERVAKFITESKIDVWENEGLRSLVEAYFTNTAKTLEILNTVMDCVEKAEMGQLLILEAVALFDKQSSEKDGGKEKNYEKILKKLKKFKVMGDPFDGQVLTAQFELIKKQQDSLLEEVCKLKKKLQEECNHLEEEIKISNAVLGATFANTAVATIANMTTGEQVAAGFSVVFSPLILIGWLGVHTALEKKEEQDKAQAKLKDQKEALEKLEKEKELSESLDKGVEINKEETKTVSILVGQLETKIKSILDYVENATEDEEDDVDPRLTLNKIKEKVNELTTKIKEVGKKVAECSELIMEAREKVEEKIIRAKA